MLAGFVATMVLMVVRAWLGDLPRSPWPIERGGPGPLAGWHFIGWAHPDQGSRIAQPRGRGRHGQDERHRVSAGLRLWTSAWRMIIRFGVAMASAEHGQVLRRDTRALWASGLMPPT